jgi:hypothetical protein
MIIDLLLIDLDIIASTIPDDQKPSPRGRLKHPSSVSRGLTASPGA